MTVNQKVEGSQGMYPSVLTLYFPPRHRAVVRILLMSRLMLRARTYFALLRITRRVKVEVHFYLSTYLAGESNPRPHGFERGAVPTPTPWTFD